MDVALTLVTINLELAESIPKSILGGISTETWRTKTKKTHGLRCPESHFTIDESTETGSMYVVCVL